MKHWVARNQTLQLDQKPLTGYSLNPRSLVNLCYRDWCLQHRKTRPLKMIPRQSRLLPPSAGMLKWPSLEHQPDDKKIKKSATEGKNKAEKRGREGWEGQEEVFPSLLLVMLLTETIHCTTSVKLHFKARVFLIKVETILLIFGKEREGRRDLDAFHKQENRS